MRPSIVRMCPGIVRMRPRIVRIPPDPPAERNNIRLKGHLVHVRSPINRFRPPERIALRKLGRERDDRDKCAALAGDRGCAQAVGFVCYVVV